MATPIINYFGYIIQNVPKYSFLNVLYTQSIWKIVVLYYLGSQVNQTRFFIIHSFLHFASMKY